MGVRSQPRRSQTDQEGEAQNKRCAAACDRIRLYLYLNFARTYPQVGEVVRQSLPGSLLPTPIVRSLTEPTPISPPSGPAPRLLQGPPSKSKFLAAHGQIAQGNIDRRLLDLISDSVGLNPSAQESRFRKQAQDQITAEALGDFDEIGDAIKGRLPHPETLHRRNHPLAGEVEAIHDSLVTTTRKRNKRGKRIRNSQKANAFFLPIGEFIDLDEVREAMNEKGFDFQTPADLLAAVSDSLAYRITTYATNSPTFSIGKDARLTYYQAHGVPASKAQEIDPDLFSWPAGKAAPYQRAPSPETGGRTGDLQSTAARFAQFAADPTSPLARRLAADLAKDLEEGKTLDYLARELFTHNHAWRPVGTVVETPQDLFKLNSIFRNPFVESLRVVVLDDASRVVHAEVLSIGTVNETAAAPRDFLRILAAANEGAPDGTRHRQIAISHNHPSGDPTPSRADRDLTRRLELVLADIDAELVDHVITNGTRGFSFAQDSEFDMDIDMDVPWALTDRSQAALIDRPDEAQKVAGILRASNKALNLAFLLNTRLRLVAAVAASSDPTQAARQVTNAMASTGANTAIVSLNAAIRPQEAWTWTREVKGRLDRAQLNLADVAHWDSIKPPFPRPPVRPHGCSRGLPPKANS